MTNEDLIPILSQSDLFIGMSRIEIEDFLTDHTYKTNSYNKNDIFALAGNRVNHLMIVLKGSLIARMVSDSGKYIQIDKIDTGRVIAPAIIFATENTYPVNVIPEDNVSVFFMHKDTFLKAMNGNEKLLHNFIRIVSDINRFLSSKIHSLSLKSIRGKLAQYILKESEMQNKENTIRIKFTRQELADEFAISRQALIRSLTELEEEGFITIKGREITIRDRNALKNEE